MAYTTINKSTDYFRNKIYTGNGVDDRNITFDETSNMQPDFVWIKSRSGTNWNTLFDAVRGAGNRIYSNEADAEDNNADSLQAFQTNGFQVGTNGSVNGNTNRLVAWTWKAGNSSGSSNTDGDVTSTVSVNTTAGFSIVKWFSTSTAGINIGHGLGQKPAMIIAKCLNHNTTSWPVYHKSLTADVYLTLNLNNQSNNHPSRWNDSEPTTTTFQTGSSGDISGSDRTMIAYCFAEKQGYSKFGSYTGNGNVDGTFVYTGFKPAFVIAKQSSGADDWRMITQNVNSRDTKTNSIDKNLYAHANTAETNTDIDFVSNGFKIRSTSGGINSSGQTFIYMAFASAPLVGSNNVPCTAR